MWYSQQDIATAIFHPNTLKQAIRHACLACALSMPLLSTQAMAAEPAVIESSKSYNIAAGALEDALTQFAQQAGVLLSFEPELVAGKNSQGLSGTYTVKQGFAKLLQASGLDIVVKENGNVGLRKLPQAEVHGGSLPEVRVAASAQTTESELPPAYAGAQVAKGARVGMLGNRDFMDTPFSITGYTRELIQNQQASTIADIVANDASVRSANPRGGRFDQFSIRGFTINNSDIALNGLYGILSTYAIAAESIERLEILKGTSSLLNGMSPGGAVGGAINVVSKRATDKPITQVTARYATKEQLGTHVDIGRRFGPDNSVGVRFNGAYQNDGETAFDHQAIKQGLGVIALDYRSDTLRLSLDAGHQERNIDAPPEKVVLTAGALVPDAKRIGQNFAPEWTYTNTRDTYAAFRAEYDFNAHINTYIAFGGRRSDYDFLRVNPRVTSAGNFSASSTLFLRDEEVFTTEAGVRAKFDTGPVGHAVTLSASKYRLVFGSASYDLVGGNSNIYNPSRLTKPMTSGFSQQTPKQGSTELNSIALTDVLSLANDRLQIILGARSQRVEVGRFESGTRISSYDENAVTPATGAVFKLRDNISIYGNYIESLSQGAAAPNNNTVINPGEVLPPIKSKQLEAGIKIDSGSFATTLSVFRIEQPSAFTENRIFGLNGEQRNVGAELNIFGEPISGVRILGGLMLLDSKLTQTLNGTNDGSRAPGTSRANLNLGVEWDTPSVEGLTLTARTIYSSSQYGDAVNLQKIPGWTRFDIGARYAVRAGQFPVTLRANVENLFDRRYWASAAAPSGASGLTISTPRTLLLSATVDF
ncbi:TonB-dependent receptor [Methylobacillus gramineus]|uniref:TonB-dependent receptor n=1 Tax=Methylobacillus gramineus TaxID=755169 RepID=UPI001CFF7746|nr:TonB-dependent receptor [Methylobacillus gramineus]MCB5184256.1 TonB-dependent receptor [Methylobacillus gramineus]